MKLKKVLDYVETTCSQTFLKIETYQKHGDNKDYTFRLLKKRIEDNFPQISIDKTTQKIDFQLNRTYNYDGDEVHEYNTIISMSKDFMKEFTEKYPEVLI